RRQDRQGRVGGLSGAGWDLPSIRQLLELGQTLGVDVECWLNQLSK
ncbi:Alpha-amylase/alpha-mannosidase, partial [uncultured Microcoleus sp.]